MICSKCEATYQVLTMDGNLHCPNCEYVQSRILEVNGHFKTNKPYMMELHPAIIRVRICSSGVGTDPMGPAPNNEFFVCLVDTEDFEDLNTNRLADIISSESGWTSNGKNESNKSIYFPFESMLEIFNLVIFNGWPIHPN